MRYHRWPEIYWLEQAEKRIDWFSRQISSREHMRVSKSAHWESKRMATSSSHLHFYVPQRNEFLGE
jgi:hypothetical protein